MGLTNTQTLQLVANSIANEQLFEKLGVKMMNEVGLDFHHDPKVAQNSLDNDEATIFFRKGMDWITVCGRIDEKFDDELIGSFKPEFFGFDHWFVYRGEKVRQLFS